MTSVTGAVIIPTIVPSIVRGKNPPSDFIQVAHIGYGRIARGLDTRSILRLDDVRVIAISEVDSKRKADGKKAIEDGYKEKGTSVDVKMYDDYSKLILRNDIDAIGICTPDH